MRRVHRFFWVVEQALEVQPLKEPEVVVEEEQMIRKGVFQRSLEVRMAPSLVG